MQVRFSSITRMLFCYLLVIATSFAQSPARGPQANAGTQGNSSITVLRGGKLLTIAKGVIDNGILIIQDGKIAAIGAAGAVTIPRGAKIIETTGMTIYPGLIDSHSRLGLTEVSMVQTTNDMVEPSEQITPHMHVADAFHAESEVIPVTRLNGITNAIVAPAGTNTLPGQMALVQLDGSTSEEMLLVRDIAMALNFTGDQRRKDKFPTTRMGMAAELRQAFIDATEYASKWDAYEQQVAEWRRKRSAEAGTNQTATGQPLPPKRDLKLEAIVPYLKGLKPIVLMARESSDLKTAMSLAREFKLRVVLGQITYTHAMLDEIAASQLPVIVGSIYSFPKVGERYDSVFRLPAELAKRGVKFAFASFNDEPHNVRNLPYAAGYAVANGLPYDEALKALTLYPAQIWGVSDRLGSLEVGKTANIVVANGDPFDLRTDVKRVFIAGREIPMVSRQTQLRDAYMK